jgi:hypothetical protein
MTEHETNQLDERVAKCLLAFADNFKNLVEAKSHLHAWQDEIRHFTKQERAKRSRNRRQTAREDVCAMVAADLIKMVRANGPFISRGIVEIDGEATPEETRGPT